MASNPWLAGVNVSKCPVCDVRLLNGSCIDHGPPAAEEVDDLPEDPKEPAEPENPEDSKEPAEPENPEEPQQQSEDKPEESQKKRRRKKTIVDTDSEDTPASSSNK